MKFSLITFYICCLFLLITCFLYYPRWQKSGSEATLSWDVSGYYMYLPAFFIYNDPQQLNFLDDILKEYQPTPHIQQATRHANGNYVFKYSAGQAIQYLPFFAIAHGVALTTSYKADGFSLPYQLGITIGSLLIAFLGLWYLRKMLLLFYSDLTTGIVLLLLVFGTNYLEYTAINGTMTHNNLFTIYALLIWTTIHFYKNPTTRRAIGIGLLLGLAALTRPTELLAVLIPTLWGIASWKDIQERFYFVLKHFKKYAFAAIACGLVGFIQLAYWKYVGGDWIIYSYREEGFSWMNPHIYDAMFSARAGWLVYTPIMSFALLGFLPLFQKHKSIFWSIGIFTVVFMYVAFAWDIWWYGGSLGQRTMVQAYAALALPFGALIEWIYPKRWLRYLFFAICAVFITYNIWLHHAAHKGGILHAGFMTKAYYFKVLGKSKSQINFDEALKLLDTDEEYLGERKNVTILYTNNFEQDTTTFSCSGIDPINGQQSLCISKERQTSPFYKVPIKNNSAEWIRATATFRCAQKEWDFWRMTHFTINFMSGKQVVKKRFIRVYRHLYDNETQELYLDVRVPKEAFDTVEVVFWNAEGDKSIVIDDLKVESFNEK